MIPRWPTYLLLVMLTGCSGITKSVHLHTGHDEPIVHTPRNSAAPVALDEDDFVGALETLARNAFPSPRPQEAARRLFEMDSRSGTYLYETGSHRVTPLGPGEQLVDVQPASEEMALTRTYLRWCERTGRAGDCLRLLAESPHVTGDGRYTLAMALAHGVVLDEMMGAFKDMADPQAMVSAVLWTWTTYCILLTVPEPFSKGLAAVMTASLIAYVGVDTFWSIIVGFKQLVEAAERATTFDELREAGERYGEVMGRNAARAFAMLATAAVGNTAAGLGWKVPRLPGATQAAAQAEAQVGIRLAAVAEVSTVSVSAETLTMTLAPGAVAMTTPGTGSASAKVRPTGFRAWGSFSGFKRAMGPAGPNKQWHHIVEQTPGNTKRFGPQALHNTENIIPMERDLHTNISAFYSSIRRDITGSPLTVRQWLSTQSFGAQRDFGLLAIENLGKGLW